MLALEIQSEITEKSGFARGSGLRLFAGGDLVIFE